MILPSPLFASQQTATVTATITVTAAPEVVKAGERVSFDVTLDNPPNFRGGSLQYVMTGPSQAYYAREVALEPGKRTYRIEFPTPIAAEGGTWTLASLSFIVGDGRNIPLKFKPLTFRVIAAPGLIFPTSVEAKINLTQVQLLRREAIVLQGRIQSLKASLAQIPEKGSDSQLTGILRENLAGALHSLGLTEESFFGLSRGNAPQTGAAKIFFGDLRLSYEQTARDLAHTKAVSNRQFEFLEARAAGQKPEAKASYPIQAQAVLRVLEQNELAYKLVGDTESLTFDLEVNSVPAGAVVYFRRRGDSDRKHDKPTNSTIAALPYAIWLVRFHLPGFEDEEREHDPFREPNHVVSVELRKQN